MIPGNARIYAPVTRAPLLFHQNNSVSNSNHYPVPQNFSAYPPAPSTLPYFSPYEQQRHFPAPAYSPSNCPPSYSYPSPGLSSLPSQSLAYAPAYIPNTAYSMPVTPNGLTLILIAILILVALDLAFVRPQKKY